jgi:hypothetical protein
VNRWEPPVEASKCPGIAERPERPNEELDDPGHRVTTGNFIFPNGEKITKEASTMPVLHI